MLEIELFYNDIIMRKNFFKTFWKRKIVNHISLLVKTVSKSSHFLCQIILNNFIKQHIRNWIIGKK